MARHHAIANPSTQQTSAALIPAPPAGSRVVVHSIYVSSDTELVVSLEHGETQFTFFKLYVGAQGGANLIVVRKTPRGQGVDYSTSGAGNVFLDVEWEYERVRED